MMFLSLSSQIHISLFSVAAGYKRGMGRAPPRLYAILEHAHPASSQNIQHVLLLAVDLYAFCRVADVTGKISIHTVGFWVIWAHSLASGIARSPFPSIAYNRLRV